MRPPETRDMSEAKKEKPTTEVANPVEPLVRRELVHRSFATTLEEFLPEIDKTGGWPSGYTYVSFYHDGPCGDRYCVFTNTPLRTGWWTTVCSADDYYYWKLSDTKKAELLKQARNQLIGQLR